MLSKWINKPPLGTPLIPGHPHRDGLIGWWPMLEGAGGTVYDYSGKGNHGTLTNMASPPTSTSGWGAGKFGVAPSYDALDDYITIPDTDELELLGNHLTLSAWIYQTVLAPLGPPTDLFVIMKEYVGTYKYAIGPAQDKFVFALYNGVVNPFVYAGTQVLNVWRHLAGTWDGATLRFYIDGIFIDDAAAAIALVGSAGNVAIGRRDTTGPYFGGIIDDVRIYNVPLTQKEIQDIMYNPFAAFQKRTYASLFVAPGISMPIVMQQMDQYNGGAVL